MDDEHEDVKPYHDCQKEHAKSLEVLLYALRRGDRFGDETDDANRGGPAAES